MERIRHLPGPHLFQSTGCAVNEKVRPTVDHILLNHLHQQAHYNLRGPIFSSMGLFSQAPLCLTAETRLGRHLDLFLTYLRAAVPPLPCLPLPRGSSPTPLPQLALTTTLPLPFTESISQTTPNITSAWSQASYFGTSISPVPQNSCPYKYHNLLLVPAT